MRRTHIYSEVAMLLTEVSWMSCICNGRVNWKEVIFPNMKCLCGYISLFYIMQDDRSSFILLWPSCFFLLSQKSLSENGSIKKHHNPHVALCATWNESLLVLPPGQVKAMHFRWSLFLLFFKPKLSVRNSPRSIILKHVGLISFPQCQLQPQSHCHSASTHTIWLILSIIHRLSKHSPERKKIYQFLKLQ